MKKMLLALCTMMVPASLLALPLGNPWEASLHKSGICWSNDCCDEWNVCPSFWDSFGYRIGYYGDYVFDRHMKVARNHSRIHKTKISTNAAYFAFNYCNRLDLFGTLGASHIELSTPFSSLGGPTVGAVNNAFVNVDTETSFSWSLGLRGTLLQWGCLGIGGEAQYFRVNPRLNSTSLAQFDTFYFPNEERPHYHEWQLGLGAAYRINISDSSSALIPYMGVKWSQCRFRADNVRSLLVVAAATPGVTIFTLEHDRSWGYAVGMTLLGCNKASVTVEGRFINEKALYVNGQFRF
ncbi:hypothetical protein ACFLR2_00475 [Chlamydiota bacterium]